MDKLSSTIFFKSNHEVSNSMLVLYYVSNMLFIHCQMMSKPNLKNLAFKLREKQREERRQARKRKETSEVIDLDVIPPTKVKEPSVWVNNLNTEDEKVLLNGDWLNDKLINAGQMLIKESYPQVYGFQDASLGQTLGFDVLTEEFVQVLHTGRGHWVTISTIGCSIAEVEIFDSMPPAIVVLYRTKLHRYFALKGRI